jgi:hypothetical protein
VAEFFPPFLENKSGTGEVERRSYEDGPAELANWSSWFPAKELQP